MSVTIDYSTWSGDAFAYMDCLYIRSEYRGSGIGWAFVNNLQQFAAHHQCVEIQWQTPPDNQLGIEFYRRIGASKKLKVRFYIDVDSNL